MPAAPTSALPTRALPRAMAARRSEVSSAATAADGWHARLSPVFSHPPTHPPCPAVALNA
jgi:hypothetical protein